MDENSVFTEEEVRELQDTQKVRKTLISALTVNGEVPREGPKQVLLLGLLDGSDRSAFTRAKLRSDKKRDEATQSAIKLVGETLKNINSRTYRPVASEIDRTIPRELENRTFVIGELEIGIEPIPITQLIQE